MYGCICYLTPCVIHPLQVTPYFRNSHDPQRPSALQIRDGIAVLAEDQYLQRVAAIADNFRPTLEYLQQNAQMLQSIQKIYSIDASLAFSKAVCLSLDHCPGQGRAHQCTVNAGEGF